MDKLFGSLNELKVDSSHFSYFSLYNPRAIASLVTQMVEICLQCERPGFNLWVGKTPWRREWLPSLVFLPGEFHEQRSLVAYSPWG